MATPQTRHDYQMEDREGAPSPQARRVGEAHTVSRGQSPQPPEGALEELRNHEPMLNARKAKCRKQVTARTVLPRENRINFCCMRGLFSNGENFHPEVHLTAAGVATLHKTARCAQVWVCPICSAQISARRAAELQGAVDQWVEDGGDVVLLTLTHHHDRNDDLADLMAAQADATQGFWRQGSLRRTLNLAGLVGRVSGLEVTYGLKTGWHPHRHVVMFIDRLSEEDKCRFAKRLKKYWQNACERAGLKASYEHGADVRFGHQAAGKYTAKFGLEVTLNHAKNQKGDRFSPWALLDYIDETGEAWAVDRFREYAQVMKGRRQLSWSRGLKERFGVDEVSDEDACGEQEESTSTPVLVLPGDTLMRLRTSKLGDLLPELLMLVEKKDYRGVEGLVRVVRGGVGWLDGHGPPLPHAAP